MMRAEGYDVTHYGVEGAESGATEQVDIMTQAEQISLLGHDFSDHTKFHGDDANLGNPLYRDFNRRLSHHLGLRVQPADIVCLTFGHGQAAAATLHPGVNVETGIGYPDTCSDFRIFESYAWMHFHQGKSQREGANYEWVIPNYFVAGDWPLVKTPQDYVLFFGRIGHSKGCQVVSELARRMPDVQFILCGQGDATPFLTSLNIEYRPPVTGIARAKLLGNARCVLMPTQFVEPFGGVAVEAMLCGTPVLGQPHGAFTETIEHGRTGYRCRVLNDWIDGINLVGGLDRAYIAERARRLWSLEAVGPQYSTVFQQIYDLHTGGGWYTCPSAL